MRDVRYELDYNAGWNSFVTGKRYLKNMTVFKMYLCKDEIEEYFDIPVRTKNIVAVFSDRPIEEGYQIELKDDDMNIIISPTQKEFTFIADSLRRRLKRYLNDTCWIGVEY